MHALLITRVQVESDCRYSFVLLRFGMLKICDVNERDLVKDCCPFQCYYAFSLPALNSSAVK